MPVKYGKYGLGQIEAILNKIGGEAVLDDLLAGKVKVVVVAVPSQESLPRKKVICQQNGSHCNICGYLFDEADTICSGGGHQIGQEYEV